MESPKNGEVSIKDRLFLDPIGKYRKYGLFPWKLLIHLLLLIFTSMQIIMIVVESANYSYNQYVVWNKLYLVRGVAGDSTLLTFNYYLFSIADLNSYFARTVENYFNINEHTVDTYQPHTDSLGEIEPMRLYVSYLDSSSVADDGYLYSYDITPDDFGPLDIDNARDFLNDVQSFYIEMKIRHKLPSKVVLACDCFEWTIRQFYDYSLHGPINVSLDLDVTICDEAYDRYVRKLAWISILVLLLALASLGIIWSYIVSRAILISHIRGSESNRDWENLTFTEKMKFVNPWMFVTFIGNLFQIFGAIMFFLVRFIPLRYFDIVAGFGSFCAWLNMLRYLQDHPNAYTVIHTFTRAFPILWRYIVGVVPLFMAFCFLAMALFWKTQYYNSTSGAMLANFALLNGDSVYMFFSGAVGVNYFWGFVYMYGFIVFFICCVHNIFIAIIGEGFTSLRKNPPKRESGIEEDSVIGAPTSPPMVRQLSFKASSPKPSINRTSHLGQKSQAVYRRIMHTSTVSERGDPTAHALEEINRIKEEIRRKIAKLKELASPPESLEADLQALKAHLEAILEGPNMRGAMATIVSDLKAAP
jgi:hypothetical protein